MKQSHEVRRSQLINTYGVGGIIPIGDESFMVAGIDRWPVRTPNLHEPRLERALSVQGFVLPPATDHGQDIPVVRFPRWMWCPGCKRIDEHRFFASRDKNICGPCGMSLVPSRFVICCANGHISDFPYFFWIHAGNKERTGGKHLMTMEMGGNTASLRDILISCSCGVSKTMEHAFSRMALQGMKCKGERPWLTADDKECDQIPRTLQRGASNVWFSITHSSISIPPWSEGAFKILNRQWPALQHIPDDVLEHVIRGMKLAEGTPYSVAALVDAVKKRKAAANRADQPLAAQIKEQEYEALCTGCEEVSKDQEFVCVKPEFVPPLADKWFEQIMLVKRLREVRVLQSFARITPPSAAAVFSRPPLFDSNPGWLPAIEVIGEGVFIRPRKNLLESWEQRTNVQQRAERINVSYVRRCRSRKVEPDRVITARMLLLHSLSHSLITQWSLESGYPAASLRERLYVSDSMAGILIYTATSDSAGSLGGIVAQAQADRLDGALRQAIANSSWCSADPLCAEADSAGVDALNLAACHACLLLPEVSCEEMNLLLDRAMLVGTPDDPSFGFFAALVKEA
ncbi:MAG: DUF1998 domain-containing protein [Planctomycetota bacterium]